MPALIISTVPEPRLERYRAIVPDDELLLEQFYTWAQELALRLFADIAVLEVAMRSSMAARLHDTYGPRWYEHDDLFDDDCASQIRRAWRDNGLGELQAQGADAARLEGKPVAAMMLGFWVKLLGRGSYANRKSGQPQRRLYDALLWHPALRHAFPNARGRRQVERHMNSMRAARNRVAHHEHVIWGIPIPGQHVRLSVTETHATLLELASYLDAPVRASLAANSTVPTCITNCPVDASQLQL